MVAFAGTRGAHFRGLLLLSHVDTLLAWPHTEGLVAPAGQTGTERSISLLRRGVAEKEFLSKNLVVRVHFIIEMMWWTGLAP